MEANQFEERFHLIRKLGRGAFGDIYEVNDITTGKKLALKLESYESDSHSQLTLEYTLYSQLAATKGFCRVYDFGRVDNNVYMVMDRLAFTIEQLFDMCGRKFQAATVFRIAVQLIDRLEELHALGYLHRDINPRNIMVGEEDCSKLYLIDFGLAKSFLQPNSKEHIQRTSGHKFTGTVKFASVAAHEGYGRAPIKVDQSRRDDLESLGFVLVYLLKGLPWEEVKLTNKLARREKISAMKHSIITEELCKNLPNELLQYFRTVRGLAFNDKPPYQKLRAFFLKTNLEKVPLDWQSKFKESISKLKELGDLQQNFPGSDN